MSETKYGQCARCGGNLIVGHRCSSMNETKPIVPSEHVHDFTDDGGGHHCCSCGLYEKDWYYQRAEAAERRVKELENRISA